MPVIKSTCVRDLKLRVNLADVISRVVTLRKAGGSRLKGLCPFHNEKTPSFHVDPDKGLYHCFGCNKSGDLIAFVRETEQLNFTEAVEALGQRFNIPIEYEDGGGGPSREERSLRKERSSRLGPPPPSSYSIGMLKRCPSASTASVKLSCSVSRTKAIKSPDLLQPKQW